MKRFVVPGAMALAFALGSQASAAIVTQFIGVNDLSKPFTFNLGSGAFTFSAVDGSFFADSTVATTGSGQILSLGAPFYNPPRPTSFFSDRGGSIGPGALYASYATPADIPFSATDSIVGFSFAAMDGTHFGYAEVAGASFTGFRYDSTAGVAVDIAPITARAAVPEPASWALLIGGFGLTGVALRRRSRQAVRA